MSSSVFANVEEGAKIEVFALTATYNSDPFKDKVNLSVGGEYIVERIDFNFSIVLINSVPNRFSTVSFVYVPS